MVSDHGDSLGEPASVADDNHARRHIRPARESIGRRNERVCARSVSSLARNALVRCPGAFQRPRGTRITAPASLEDITPTLTDALGLHPRGTFDGTSWLPDSRCSGRKSRRPRSLHGIRIHTARLRVRRYLDDAQHARRGSVLSRRRRDRQSAGPSRTPSAAARESSVRRRARRRDASLRAVGQHTSSTSSTSSALAPPRCGWPRQPDSAAGALYDLWNALATRFEYVRERPIAPPLGDVDEVASRVVRTAAQQPNPWPVSLRRLSGRVDRGSQYSQVSGDVVLCALAGAVAAATVCVIGYRLVLGTWHRAALCAAITVILFYGFGPLSMAAESAGMSISPTLLPRRGWSYWQRGPGSALRSRVANRATVPPVQSRGGAVGRERRRPRHCPSWLANPAQSHCQHGARTHPTGLDSPDIYYIILDWLCTRRLYLKEHYGHDNSPFLDTLRSRGF